MATAAILPKVSATLSICGSAAILTECFYFDRTRLQRVHHRILCLMAIFDILDSPWFFATLLVWTVRKVESASRKYHSSYYAAAPLRKKNSKVNRSKARKKLQGERKDLQRGVTEMDRLERMVELNRKIEEVRAKKSLQNDTHSVLQLRSKTNEIKNLLTEGQDISSHFHSIATDVTDEEKQNETQQNELTINSNGCISSSRSSVGKVDATKRRAMHVKPHVQPQEVYKVDKRKRSKTRVVAEQSFFYLLAFFLTYGWSIPNQFLHLFGVSVPYWLKCLHIFFRPMQGFFNFMVYIRPSFLAHRRIHPHLTLMQCLVSLITHRETASADLNAEIENEAKEEIRKIQEVTLQDNTQGERVTVDIETPGEIENEAKEEVRKVKAIALQENTKGERVTVDIETSGLTESTLSVDVSTLGQSLRCSESALAVFPGLSIMDELPKNEESVLQQFPIGSLGGSK
jgi:hypothetical protein